MPGGTEPKAICVGFPVPSRSLVPRQPCPAPTPVLALCGDQPRGPMRPLLGAMLFNEKM